MCGITGLLATATLNQSALAAQVRAMADTLRHRGPDDAGVWTDADAGIGLGFRRLAVIDLSPQGHQPMASASGRYLIVYNGEIYNYADIRRQVENVAGNLSWRGHSDTEVMLAAFEQWGVEGSLARFNGMFAFALWDRQTRKLHLARDRMGEKPLYWGMVRGQFAFASELKALRALPGFDAPIDRNSLALYLRYNYVPAPWSIYEGIRKVRPGTRLEISMRAQCDVEVSEKTYWDLPTVARAAIANPASADENVAMGDLQSRLETSVGMRMVADVPVGAFLSGGVDSTVIVALMQRLSRRPVQTFTIGFRDPAFDEAPFAKRLAEHIGTDHTELYISSEQARAVIPNLPAIYDEPFADSSQIPTFLISRLARSKVTVALSGDGGDELFGGYERYVRGSNLNRMSALLPRWARHTAAAVLKTASPTTLDSMVRILEPAIPSRLHFAHAGEKLHKLADVLGEDDPHALYLALISSWRGEAVPVLAANSPTTLHQSLARSAPKLRFEQWMMLVDQCTYLPDDILVKVDRAAMAVSLETRVPLLDHELVQYAWSVPLSLKYRNGRGKYLLRALLYRLVPRELVDRPKRGFAVPMAEWLRGPLREWVDALLDEGRLRREGFLDVARVRACWQRHLSGSRNVQDELWGVLSFQAWLESTRAD